MCGVLRGHKYYPVEAGLVVLLRRAKSDILHYGTAIKLYGLVTRLENQVVCFILS